MKIAYAHVIEDVSRLPGVFNKVRDQQRACQEAGVPIRVHVFSYEETGLDTGTVRFHVLKEKKGKKGRRDKAAKLYFQARDIARELSDYDVVILRALAWTPMYVPGMKKKDFTLITEHHTKTMGELLSGKRYASFLSHALFKKSCMKLSDGVLCVTGEICRDTCGGALKGLPTQTIPNGVDVDCIKKTGSAAFDETGLHLAFVASTLQPWHGLDRITRGLALYEGEMPIHLHLVGAIPEDAVRNTNPLVKTRFHGILDRSAMDRVLLKMHLGISSLAIFRNRMKEACVLKSREYMARGLPFVYAYDDPGIPEDFPCCLKIEATESPVLLARLIDFARQMETRKKTGDVPGLMRETARKHMDWKPKMQAMHDFAKHVFAMGKP